MIGTGFDVLLVRVKLEGLLVYHLLQDFLGRLEIVPSPIKWLLALWLGFLIMKSFEIWVLEALLDCVALLGIEDQHLTQKIEGHWVRLGVQGRPGLLVAFGQLTNVFSCKIITNKSHILSSGCAKYGNSSLNLIKIVVTGEQWCTSKKLSEYATD
jgi:hypothetical protein